MDSNTRNLRALAWIIAQDGDENFENAYAIDPIYVYRREVSLSEAVPRPRYFRAEHREVLADDKAWDEGRAWEACTETGAPLFPTWHVQIKFNESQFVSAKDSDAARVKAISRLHLPDAVLRHVEATATLLPSDAGESTNG